MRLLGSWLLLSCISCPSLCGAAKAGAQASLTAAQIVQKSVDVNDADWRQAPQYAFTESDIITRHGRTTRKQFEVVMIEGSTYNKLLAVNGEPLPRAAAQAEEAKLRQEEVLRRNETPAARRKRIQKYLDERRQDHDMMGQMVKGFEFKLAGVATVNGRRCYVLQATPRPGYNPPNRDTKALTGMRGTLWVDAEEFQWVKVHAEVFRPVAFGLFIAQVKPGTEFTLENAPVSPGLWLPCHFRTVVKASVLGVWPLNSLDDETYTNYKLMSQVMLTSARR